MKSGLSFDWFGFAPEVVYSLAGTRISIVSQILDAAFIRLEIGDGWRKRTVTSKSGKSTGKKMVKGKVGKNGVWRKNRAA